MENEDHSPIFQLKNSKSRKLSATLRIQGMPASLHSPEASPLTQNLRPQLQIVTQQSQLDDFKARASRLEDRSNKYVSKYDKVTTEQYRKVCYLLHKACKFLVEMELYVFTLDRRSQRSQLIAFDVAGERKQVHLLIGTYKANVCESLVFFLSEANTTMSEADEDQCLTLALPVLLDTLRRITLLHRFPGAAVLTSYFAASSDVQNSLKSMICEVDVALQSELTHFAVLCMTVGNKRELAQLYRKSLLLVQKAKLETVDRRTLKALRSVKVPHFEPNFGSIVAVVFGQHEDVNVSRHLDRVKGYLNEAWFHMMSTVAVLNCDSQ